MMVDTKTKQAARRSAKAAKSCRASGPPRLSPAQLLLVGKPFIQSIVYRPSPVANMSSSTANGGHSEAPTRTFKVLTIGGSYGGLAASLNLLDLCAGRPPRGAPPPAEADPNRINVDITVVDERDGFYHLIGSPMALASESYSEKAWVKYEDLPGVQAPNVRVVQGSVTEVDCARKVATVTKPGQEATVKFDYDYLVAASGLRRVWPVVPQSLNRKQYLYECAEHIQNVSSADKGVVVVGGGAVGIEMAGELKMIQPHVKVTLVHSRNKLMSSEPLPDEAKDTALALLRESGVEVLLDHRLQETKVVNVDGGKPLQELIFTNGHRLTANHTIMAISRSVPSTTFLPREALDHEGYIKIQSSMQFPEEVPNAADHFAVGDNVHWSGIKRCGGAMHSGHWAAVNIHQLMKQKLFGSEPDLRRLPEVPPMIGLAVGKKAMSYGPDQGVQTGEDVAKIFFEHDLGLGICWRVLGLSKPHEEAK